MSEMIERVAAAIEAVTDKFDAPVRMYVEDEARYRWSQQNPDADASEAGIDFAKESWKIIARAAIQAMRHPTKTMLQAGRETMPVIDHSEETWRAMIDAALPAGQG